ncbi:putative transmembrane protein [Gregarina niphandrodes]|uniref:Transmembrane protein n=1 Tax=Gregarina niphandrodes TaxID=110365 RepID=A0A023B0D9_GRENI|nr:putative transmembrane protein [Gregarina niphandrodes]EZG44780.1 putative transmembrane protein [Gregarina niphandrodes]|eukprot:XP_011132662.1 putative transmembrane protein [Gregarina niphandrodes]
MPTPTPMTTIPLRRSASAYKHAWWLAFVLASCWTLVNQLQHSYTMGVISTSSDNTDSIERDIATAIEKQLFYVRPWPRALGYLISLAAGVYLAEVDSAEQKSAIVAGATPLLGSPLPGAEPTPLHRAPATPAATPPATPASLMERHRPTSKLAHHVRVNWSSVSRWLWCGHMSALTLMCMCVWLPWIRHRWFPNMPYVVTVLYNVGARVVWTACVLWFVFACYAVRRGTIKDTMTATVDTCLGARGFSTLSPLVFGTYLVHMALQTVYYATVPIVATVSLWEGFHESLSWTPLAFAVALPLYLCVETPVTRLLTKPKKIE